jgi:hypothetical protein
MSATSIYGYLWLYSPFVGPWTLFQFLNPIHSRQDSLDWGRPFARPLTTHRITQNKCTQTSIPWVRFEYTIPEFERAKTVQVLEWRSATYPNKEQHIWSSLFFRFFCFPVSYFLLHILFTDTISLHLFFIERESSLQTHATRKVKL